MRTSFQLEGKVLYKHQAYRSKGYTLVADEAAWCNSQRRMTEMWIYKHFFNLPHPMGRCVQHIANGNAAVLRSQGQLWSKDKFGPCCPLGDHAY